MILVRPGRVYNDLVTKEGGLLTIQDEHTTERGLERAFLAKMARELQAIRNNLEVNNFLIDEWKYEQSATLAQPLPEYDGPIIVTSIVAVYPPTSELAQINLGRPDRIIPIINNIDTTVQTEGSVTSPSASQIVASISAASLLAVAPAGTFWNVTWTIELGGTIAAIDANNLNLVCPLATIRENGIYPAIVGTYPQEPTSFPVQAAQNISAVTIGAGTVGSIYTVQITATPVNAANSSGVFALDSLQMKIGQRDGARNLQISPAGACYVNFFGYADRRQVDHR